MLIWHHQMLCTPSRSHPGKQRREPMVHPSDIYIWQVTIHLYSACAIGLNSGAYQLMQT